MFHCEYIPLFGGDDFDNARLHAILVNLLDKFLETAELIHRLGIRQYDTHSQRRPVAYNVSEPFSAWRILTGLKTGTFPPS